MHRYTRYIHVSVCIYIHISVYTLHICMYIYIYVYSLHTDICMHYYRVVIIIINISINNMIKVLPLPLEMFTCLKYLPYKSASMGIVDTIYLISQQQ